MIFQNIINIIITLFNLLIIFCYDVIKNNQIYKYVIVTYFNEIDFNTHYKYINNDENIINYNKDILVNNNSIFMNWNITSFSLFINILFIVIL